MKRGISLILIIIMFFIVIILGFVCTLVINNNSSFFNIKRYRNLKEELTNEVNSAIYEYEGYLGKSFTIIPGYIFKGEEDKFPKFVKSDKEFIISSDDFNCLKDENLKNISIYMDSTGKITMKYLFFYV